MQEDADEDKGADDDAENIEVEECMNACVAGMQALWICICAFLNSDCEKNEDDDAQDACVTCKQGLPHSTCLLLPGYPIITHNQTTNIITLFESLEQHIITPDNKYQTHA